jgi:hypothetical protein
LAEFVLRWGFLTTEITESTKKRRGCKALDQNAYPFFCFPILLMQALRIWNFFMRDEDEK